MNEAIKFVQDYNSIHGRGGEAKAAEKFGLNPIDIIRAMRPELVREVDPEQNPDDLQVEFDFS
ncbi:MAG: hypothetical protein AAF226_05485 [Verrucomicrobiota bacterium]